MRGASALQSLLSERVGTKLRLYVVWMPAIPSDLGPPTNQVMSQVHDARVRQFWDPERVLSSDLIRSFRSAPEKLGHAPEQFRDPAFFVWDWLAVYGRDSEWTSSAPTPVYAGGIVVDVIGEAGQAVDAASRR